jgi:hypothetical protein
MTEPLCHDDGAYVLGALSPSERRTFELHLADCPTCQRSVRELAGLPGLLAKVAPGDFDSAEQPPPDTLLPGLIKAVQRRRTHRRQLLGGVAVAAALTALIVAIGVRGLTPDTPSAGGVVMSRVTDTAISARAQLSAEPWGTRIALLCRYDHSSPYTPAGRTYALIVVNDNGRTRQVATWKVVPHGVSTVTGSIGWSKADIAQLEIRTIHGSPVLRLTT